jgi:hypothetical protein
MWISMLYTHNEALGGISLTTEEEKADSECPDMGPLKQRLEGMEIS